MENILIFSPVANISAIAKEWNTFRAEMFREAVVLHLIPAFEREHKQRLLAEAKEVALERCEETSSGKQGNSFPSVCVFLSTYLAITMPPALERYSSAIWGMASRPPLRLTSENDDGEVVIDRPRVMAAVWGPSGDTGQVGPQQESHVIRRTVELQLNRS